MLQRACWFGALSLGFFGLAGCKAAIPTRADQAGTSACDASLPPASESLLLERDGCFGPCPDYSVEVRRDGIVIYDGDSFVRVRGKVCATIPTSAAEALFAEASRAGASTWEPQYNAGSSDQDSATIIMKVGRNAPVRVWDYPPCHTEDPKTPVELCKLEASIDRAAGTSKWTACISPDGSETQCPQ